MTKVRKILLFIIFAIIIVGMLGLMLIALWARPNRLDETECRALIKTAWEAGQNGSPTGIRELEYRLGNKDFKIRADMSEANKYPVFKEFLSNMFPQAEPDDAFLDRFEIRHTGRTRAAGRAVEKIRLSPVEYRGDSVEVWVDPGSGYALGWRRLDPEGGMIRGFHFRVIKNFPEKSEDGGGEETGEDIFQDFQGMGGRNFLGPDEFAGASERNKPSLPEWLPPGFKLIGGRMIPGIDPSDEFGGIMPGGGIGRLRQNAGGPGGMGMGHFHVIYSDGLNTISVMYHQMGRFMESSVDPGRIEEILESKSEQVREIFHTSMSGRLLLGNVVILFGGVDQEVLKRVADSIPIPVDMPEPGLRLPFLEQDDMQPPFDRPRRGNPGERRFGDPNAPPRPRGPE